MQSTVFNTPTVSVKVGVSVDRQPVPLQKKTSNRADHLNLVWHKLEDVTYPRLEAGKHLVVSAPNGRAPVNKIVSEELLYTAGAQNALTTCDGNVPSISHCAHYYLNRRCLRGAKCGFVHAVHLNPECTIGQRAPRGRVDEKEVSDNQSNTSSSETGMSTVSSTTNSAPLPTYIPAPVQSTPYQQPVMMVPIHPQAMRMMPMPMVPMVLQGPAPQMMMPVMTPHGTAFVPTLPTYGSGF
jgi:hypothetical protein